VNSLHSFSNHVCGLTAKTVKAGTHTFGTGVTRVGERDVASVPSKSSISNPFSFSTRWSNPHPGFASMMNNRKRPLSVEFKNFVVSDVLRSQGINDLDTVVSQNKLWSYPKQVSASSKSKRTHKFEESLNTVCENQQTIGRKEREQDQRGTRPNIVASGAKDLIHIPSIAGETK
jgi:hypothetical protein